MKKFLFLILMVFLFSYAKEKESIGQVESDISLLVGQKVTIYGDALINIPIKNDLLVTYTCDIGTKSGNNFVINPVTGNIGVHTLTMTFKNNGLLITTKTITMTVYDLAPARTKKILMIGNSLTKQGNDYYHNQMDAILNNCTLTFVGTQGTTTKHEGYGGYWFGTFCAKGPFVKDGVLDIPAYFKDNSIATPDVVFIRLGANPCYGCSEISLTDSARTSYLDGEITHAKELIDGFLTYDVNLKIILGLPTISENTGAGWNANYDESLYSQDIYIEWIHRFWDLMVTNFDNGVYSTRVFLTREAMFLDRNEGYPKSGGIHINGLHPSKSGYEQLGAGMALVLNKLLIND